MSVERELVESVDIKLPSMSPTMQSDASIDGDTNVMQITSNSTDKLSPPLSDILSSEPKAKKRRKQSNPLKIQNPSSPKFDLSSYELEEQEETEAGQLITYPVSEEYRSEGLICEKSKTPESTSQKASISRVTNALYNKLRESAKANSNGTKSKDSSLQSLTDISSPESTEEAISNNEFKNSTQLYPQLQSLLPINPVDIARDAIKLSNMYPFSELSPSMQQGNSPLSISQRSFITSSGVRVFNPEAYCELCEKEFCNKYFLKTHKANKHGICSIDNPSTYNYKAPFKNLQVSPQTTQQVINQMCENGATFGSVDSYCNICQKYFCNKYFLKKHRQNIHGIHDDSNVIPSIHVPVISSPLPLVRGSHESKSAENSAGYSTKDEDSKLNISLENIKNSLNASSLLNGSSPLALLQNKKPIQSIIQQEKKNEKFLCELCNIEFCDKCYLDTHKANKHGQTKALGNDFQDFSEVGKIELEKPNEDIDDSKDNFKGQMCAPCKKNFTSAESFQQHMLEIHGASLKDEDEISRPPDFMGIKNGQIKSENDISIDKSPNSLEIDLESNSSTDSGSFSCSMCFMKCKDKKSFILHLESEHKVLSTVSLVDKLDMSSVDSYSCDLCQEQFQDRVGLMSHKFKIHGVVPPELEAFSDGIENGDYSFYSNSRPKSGGSSFCQICNKELCNKYFMKTHMMKMHGIDVDKGQLERLPPSTGGGVFCDICQKFLCSKYFLKVHKQNVHGIMDESSKLSMVTCPSYNNLLQEVKSDKNSFFQIAKLNNLPTDSTLNDDEPSKSINLFLCEICGQDFSDKISLQIHLVNKHVKSGDPYGINLHPNLADDSKDVLKGGVLPCSCCSFVNLDDSSKLSQNDSDMRMISCIVCNVTYGQVDYHTHHLSHGISLPPSKKITENGVHELGAGYDLSKNGVMEADKQQPRKLKRFRCSKCDKTFRTKLRCMQHIQVMHKSKKVVSEQMSPQKKSSLNNLSARKLCELKVNSHVLVNGTGLMGDHGNDHESLLNSGLLDGSQMPVPYKLPKHSDVIMQPFHLSEPKPDGFSKQSMFVPSLVYLPVSQKVSETLTVAFTLTPA